ncbi:transferase, partial [Streptomyces avermitilis]
ALELFTVEQNVAAFHGIYLEIVSHSPVRRVFVDGTGEPLPFGVPAEAHVPGRWTEVSLLAGGRPRWAGAAAPGAPVRGTTPVRATPLPAVASACPAPAVPAAPGASAVSSGPQEPVVAGEGAR